MKIKPTGFATPPSKHLKKWENIISTFMKADYENLRKIHRGGTRGRIFANLVTMCFDLLGYSYLSEPIFEHVKVSDWYIIFSEKHNLKLVIDKSYNPDFVFNDGSWVEVTLSENTAYKKVFRYAHQTSNLIVIWLDTDTGLHKDVCKRVNFPNATIRPIEWYYPQLQKIEGGQDIIYKFDNLRSLKNDIL